jgi:hypothetical protein
MTGLEKIIDKNKKNYYLQPRGLCDLLVTGYF